MRLMPSTACTRLSACSTPSLYAWSVTLRLVLVKIAAAVLVGRRSNSSASRFAPRSDWLPGTLMPPLISSPLTWRAPSTEMPTNTIQAASTSQRKRATKLPRLGKNPWLTRSTPPDVLASWLDVGHFIHGHRRQSTLDVDGAELLGRHVVG